MTAAERIAAALVGKERGFRGPGREQLHVAVYAVDLHECCAAVAKPDQKVLDLMAAAAKSGLDEAKKIEVAVQADDAYHVLDMIGPAPQLHE